MSKSIAEQGLAIIREFEQGPGGGPALKAYPCPSGVWTIGWGHTKGVKPGDTCTEAEAEQYLRDDTRDADRAVNRFVSVPLTQNQFDALSSFVFNLGAGSLQMSTLLRLLNRQDYKGAAEEFGRWVRSGGKVLAGLVKRRKLERELFEKAE